MQRARTIFRPLLDLVRPAKRTWLFPSQSESMRPTRYYFNLNNFRKMRNLFAGLALLDEIARNPG